MSAKTTKPQDRVPFCVKTDRGAPTKVNKATLERVNITRGIEVNTPDTTQIKVLFGWWC